MEQRLPAVPRAHRAAVALGKARTAVVGFAKGLERLAGVLKGGGAELEVAFADVLRIESLDEELKAVAGQCLAWQEVGESEGLVATRLLTVSASLMKADRGCGEEAERCEEEARRLRQGLAEAEVAHARLFAKPSSAVGRLLRRRPLRNEEEERTLLDGQWAATGSALEQIVLRLEALRGKSCAALNEAAVEVRMHAGSLGEQLVNLQPGLVRRSSTNVVSKKLSGLIKSMSTSEGRQKLRDAEAAEATLMPQAEAVVEMVAPPAEEQGAGSWRIRGVYEYQVLKAGLRHLDRTWPEDGLLTFPRKEGGAVLFRERLLSQLLQGTLRLQSVTNNDVSAAQRDLERLTLRQILRLRVAHLDFVPSGCGADTVTAVGGVHEAFLTKLDGLLFRLLGQKALAVKEAWAAALLEGEAHRLGRQAVLMASAAQSVTVPQWWCWWASPERRVFFHAGRFEAAEAFPEGGTLEVNDLSKADKHEPTGNLRWFDWRIEHVKDEESLAAAPALPETPSKGASSTPKGASSLGGMETTPPGGRASSTGAATAAMVSPGVLTDVRSSLRKTGSLPVA